MRIPSGTCDIEESEHRVVSRIQQSEGQLFRKLQVDEEARKQEQRLNAEFRADITATLEKPEKAAQRFHNEVSGTLPPKQTAPENRGRLHSPHWNQSYS